MVTTPRLLRAVRMARRAPPETTPMKTMTLDQYINDPPPSPTPVPITPVRPCFSMLDGGLMRTRPGPTMLALYGSLEEVARAVDAAGDKGVAPDQILISKRIDAPDVDVALTFLLFISAATRDAHDLYRANCPCVEGEALSRFQTLQDLEDTDDPEFGPVAVGLPAAPPRPRLAE
jgi:hypothetical protein